MRKLGWMAAGMLGLAAAAGTRPAVPPTAPGLAPASTVANADRCAPAAIPELATPDADVDLLVATIPDPRVPRHRRYHDHAIAAINAGMLEAGYVLERFAFPWQGSLSAQGGGEDGCYGYLLFRQDRWRDGAPAVTPAPDPARCQHDVCRQLVLLLPERSTWGVSTAGFAAVIARVGADLRRPGVRLARMPECPPAAGAPAPLVVLGPWFSGSVEAVARAAAGLAPEDAIRGVCAVSPSVSASSNAAIRDRVASAPPRFRLVSLAVSDTARMQTLARLALAPLGLDRLGPEALEAAVTACASTGQAGKACRTGEQVAFLTEATVFGQDICPSRGTRQFDALDAMHRLLCVQSLQLSFPANIAALRQDVGASAAKARDAAPLKLPMAGAHLSLNTNDDDGSEFPESVQASTTAASAELQLAAALDRLSLSHARIVVVVATDVRDRLYLFEQVHARLPEALLVDFTSDQLLAHADAVAATRGALVLASSELLCAQTNDRYCFNVGEYPNQLRFRAQGLRVSAWPTDAHAILEKAVSRIGRGSPGICPPADGAGCEVRPPLPQVVGFKGLYSLAGRGSDRNLVRRLVPGLVIGLLALFVAAGWLHGDQRLREQLAAPAAADAPADAPSRRWSRALVPVLPVLGYGLFAQSLDYALLAVVVVIALLLAALLERQFVVCHQIWESLRADHGGRAPQAPGRHWGGLACVLLFIAIIALLLIAEARLWFVSAETAQRLQLDARALRALALDSGTGLAWFIAIVLVQVALAALAALLLTGLAANARNGRLLPNEAPLRDLFERFLDWRDPVIGLVALPSALVALIVGFGGLRRTVFGDLASACVLAGVTATTIGAMVLLAAQFNISRRVLRLSAYVRHRIALNLADAKAEEIPGRWQPEDVHFPLSFPATPVTATSEAVGAQAALYLDPGRLDAWRQQLSEDLASEPKALPSRLPLYLLFASEMSLFRGAAGGAVLSALVSVLLVYLFPVTAAGSFVGINVVVLAVAGLLSGLMAVQFERDEVLSNILCNRTRETQFSSSLFAYIAFPFVVLAAAIAITGIPGMLDWGGGLIGWLLDKIGAGL